MARKERNVAKLANQANRLLKRMAFAFQRGTASAPRPPTKPTAFPAAGPPARPVRTQSRPRQQYGYSDPFYHYTPGYYDPYRFDPCPGIGIWPHTSGGGAGGGGHGGLGGWDSIMHHMGDPFRTIAEQIEHTAGRAGEVVQEGITRAEEGVNWLVHEAHEAVEGLPIPDALEQRLESLIGLGPALLQDHDLLNEAQGLATQLGGEVSHALGSVLAEAREFGQDLQSAVTGLGATASEVFDQVSVVNPFESITEGGSRIFSSGSSQVGGALSSVPDPLPTDMSNARNEFTDGTDVAEGTETEDYTDAVGDAGDGVGAEPRGEADDQGSPNDLGSPDDDRDLADNDGDIDRDDGNDVGDVVEMYGSAGPRDLPDGGKGGGGYCVGPVRAGHHVGSADNERRSKRRLATVGKPPAAWDVVGLEDAFRRMWRSALVSSFKAHGIFEPLEYKTLARAFTHTEPGRDRQQVTLVTQCSTDRLASLEAQVHAWGGPVSVAVYISTASRSTLQAQLQAVRDTVTRLSASPDGASYDVALVFGQEGCADTEEGAWVSDERHGLYPINALRNVALCQAQRDPICRRVLLVDVDFIPYPQGMCARLCCFYEQQALKGCSEAIEQLGALVIPAFSVDMPFPPTQSLDKPELSALYQQGKAWGFHTRHFPQGHRATNFDRWFKPLSSDKSECYEVPYEQYFEPYIVMDKYRVPLYDERFKGYGMNKIAHLYQVAREPGMRFWVWGGGFLVSRDHDNSPSWEQTYGKTKEPTRKFYLEALYCRFKEDVHNGVAPCISRVTASLYTEALRDKVELCTPAPDAAEGKEWRTECATKRVDCTREPVHLASAELSKRPQERSVLKHAHPLFKAARRVKTGQEAKHRLLHRLRDLQRAYLSSRGQGRKSLDSEPAAGVVENVVV